ncbi:MAG: Glu/Leu/Phe/Val dehydrogenase [Deltaproteobacteria bacterium]|nr:Glu/Leu/Phe/Val dehydrogenase [Deltaproteobacteria bacterium]
MTTTPTSGRQESLHIDRQTPQLVCAVRRDEQPLGWLVIDSSVAGTSCGGLRLLPDVSEAEMRGLARAMTLKYGLLGLPHGGAKAGVIGDPEAPRASRQATLAAFAEAIAPLLRQKVFSPHTDMGTDADDIASMLESVGIRLPRRQQRSGDSGLYTAMTVFCGVQRAAAHLGRSVGGASAAVEGFGKVGQPLVAMLGECGARVVAVSTSRGALFDPRGLDLERLQALAEESGSRVVELYEGGTRLACEELLELEVDILCPCARHDSIHADNVGSIAARIISPGANNPVTPAAEIALAKRGVLCLPDFVTNSGGVLGGTMEFASVKTPVIRSFIERHLGERMGWMLKEAERRQTTPRELATAMAMARSAEVRAGSEHPSLFGRALGSTLKLYRHGWIPGRLVAPLSLRYFRAALATTG